MTYLWYNIFRYLSTKLKTWQLISKHSEVTVQKVLITQALGLILQQENIIFISEHHAIKKTKDEKH